MQEFMATTTGQIEGYRIEDYLGIASGEVVLGFNMIRDWFASVHDSMGGRVGTYEKAIKDGEKQALMTMVERAKSIGANAIVGVCFDHAVLSPRGKGTVVMVTCSGTAVRVKETSA